MIYARKKDRQHNTIITDLRAVGAEVHELYQFPGCLDILCAYRGQLYWAEIKNDVRTAEKDLTEAERALIARFAAVGVRLYVWASADQALRDIGAID
jgi:hypothetical protein